MKKTPLKRGTKQMKKGTLRKKRKNRSPREILRDKAWSTFSKWIRNRDKRCVTCGSLDTPQAGHRWHAVLDFDEININQQCSGCNKWRQGNLSKYDDYLIAKYGIEEWNALYDRKNKALGGEYRTDEDYQNLIDKYQIEEAELLSISVNGEELKGYRNK